MSLKKIVLTFFLSVFVLVQSPGVALAVAVAVTGKAKVLNTNNSYLDFTNYNSNVTFDNVSGNFSGYGFLEDMGWVAFGSTDNSLGPVNLNLTSGAVTGKAKSLNTGAYVDFTNYSSNVTVNTTTGVFTGYAFSEDVGWLNFADTGVLTAPPEIETNSPSSLSYTNNQRPTVRWKAPSFGSSSLTKYRVEFDNGDTGDFTVDSIPVSGTQTYETDRFVVNFDNFSDSDAGNNYISVYTKSSSLWGGSENDGKLKEGKRSVRVSAHDNAGSITTGTRDFFVDQTVPSVAVTKINNSAFAGNLATADTTPTILGRVTDSLAGDKTENKAASGPKSIEVRLEKRNFLGVYNLHSLATVNLTESYWSTTGSKITDNTQNTADKYSTFSFTPQEGLTLGIYKVTVTGKDNAGNGSSAALFNLNITTFEEIIAPEEEKEEIIEKEPERVIEVPPFPEPEAVENFVSSVIKVVAGIYWDIIGGVKVATGYVATVWQGYTGLVYNSSQISLAFIGRLFETAGQTIAGSYNALAQKAPGVVGKVMLAVSNTLRTSANRIASAFKSATSAIVEATRPARTALGNFAYRQQVKLVSIAEILFDKNPTVITSVKIAEVGKDYAVITWETNHYTKNNKVNYGESLSYGQEALSQERARHHEFKITDLEPNQKYFFEVMSQNENYVYDAYYEFITLGDGSGIPSPKVQGIRTSGGQFLLPSILVIVVLLGGGLIFFWRRRKK